ncbi:sensor histidine kinase [Lachnoclostridium sp. Marseille-P6806]|uniref:sensor histidine kinase n=1 Tax=Lachnoclostridium sp. Marseille-P6806 TaxID=2364793 RepID=UPI0010324392|nr:histidine kinase [Lachnoclostridium sp. Marseille-P6806]
MKEKKLFRPIFLLKFQSKLFLSFIFCSMVPLIAMGFLSYRYTYRNAVERVLQTTIRSDDLLNSQLNDRIRQVETVADTLQYDMYTLNQSQGDISDELSVFTNVRNNISLYKSTFDFLHIFVFLPDNCIGSDEGLTFFSIEDLKKFQSFSNSSGISSLWFYQSDIVLPELVSSRNPSDSVGCARILTDQTTGKTDYAYIIFLQPRELSGLLRQTYTDLSIASYILSSDGQIMAHTDEALNGSAIPRDHFRHLISSGSEFLSGHTHYHVIKLANGWFHVTEIPQEYIDSNIHVLVMSIFVIFLLTTSSIAALTIVLSRTLSKRLTTISDAMEAFRLGHSFPKEKEQQLVLAGNEKDYDDFDKLGVTFLEMNHSINRSMHSILELSLTEEKLRYKLLQSQINPHFLYNILGTINNCISLGKLDIATKMTTNLTQFYRLTLRKSDEMIQIRDELEISRLYLALEKLCHNDTLSWEIHAEDGIENFYICKFTLQPFLENSIHYGYAPGIDKIHITVDIRYGDDTVIATVQDNGKGIENDRLAELQKMLKSNSLSYTKHFGIGNVNRRISSPNYGNGKIEICSADAGGTLITITLNQIDEYREQNI